jgi:hypothetical protein
MRSVPPSSNHDEHCDRFSVANLLLWLSWDRRRRRTPVHAISILRGKLDYECVKYEENKPLAAARAGSEATRSCADQRVEAHRDGRCRSNVW